MRELLAKGYVITAPRIKVLVSCYVPAGTLPAIPERMPQQVAVPQRGKAAL